MKTKTPRRVDMFSCPEPKPRGFGTVYAAAVRSKADPHRSRRNTVERGDGPTRRIPRRMRSGSSAAETDRAQRLAAGCLGLLEAFADVSGAQLAPRFFLARLGAREQPLRARKAAGSHRCACA